MEKAKKFIRLFLGIPVTILAFIFLGKVFLGNNEIIITSFKELDLLFFSIGTLFFAQFFLLKSLIWLSILKKRGHFQEIRSSLFRYSLSEIKRYIPGSVFAFIGRVQTHEIPRKETIKGLGIEALVLVLSAILVSLPAREYE